MKTSLKKLLCTLIALALLIVPVATFAEDEPPLIQIGIGRDARSNFLVTLPDLDTSNLYLNGIRYMPPVAYKNTIVMFTGDLMAAKGAADVIAQYNSANPQNSFDSAAGLLIIAKGGASLAKSALPDPMAVSTKLAKIESPDLLHINYARKLTEALAAFKGELLQMAPNADDYYLQRIEILLDSVGRSSKSFVNGISNIYRLLYEIRAAIACGTLPQSLLTGESIRNLLTIFRKVLEEGGMDLAEYGFWDNDHSWVAYAAAHSQLKVNLGDVFSISDNRVERTLSPEEYCYEPPMPEPPEPDIPL